MKFLNQKNSINWIEIFPKKELAQKISIEWRISLNFYCKKTSYPFTNYSKESTLFKKKEEEFREIFSEHYALIVKVCRMYSDSEVELEDNIQEVALQLWKSFKNFEGRSKFSTWVYKVALNVCMFQLKKRKRVRQVKEQWVNNLPEDDLEQKKKLEEQSNILSNAIKQLKEIDRAIILLYLEEVPYKEISEILGITITNVGARINRIKTRLKEIIHG